MQMRVSKESSTNVLTNIDVWNQQRLILTQNDGFSLLYTHHRIVCTKSCFNYPIIILSDLYHAAETFFVFVRRESIKAGLFHWEQIITHNIDCICRQLSIPIQCVTFLK